MVHGPQTALLAQWIALPIASSSHLPVSIAAS